jgi:cytoskeletal protein RodZ
MTELKRKVTLKHKVGESPPPKKSNKKWWTWSLFAIVAVGIVVFVLIKYSTSNDASNNDKAQTGQAVVSGQSSSADSATEGTTPTGDSATTETETSESGSNEQAATPAETPASSEAKPAESKPAAPAQSVQPKNAALSGTLEEKAKKVIRGNFGNGAERKRQLGNEYAEIQRKVNEMYRNGEVY